MIRNIRVKNFKNFKDAEFDVRPLNIFIGPNGVGKSNLGNFLLMISSFLLPVPSAAHSVPVPSPSGRP